MKIPSRFAVLPVLLTATLLVAGCETVAPLAYTGTAERYSCVNGGGLAARYNASHRHLALTYTLDGQTLYQGDLRHIDADFGSRFQGDDGVSFWVNGDKGLLSRPGDEMLLCHGEGS